jgi:hypothetical protein
MLAGCGKDGTWVVQAGQMSPSPRNRSSCSRWSRENTGTKFSSKPPSQHGRISSVPWFLVPSTEETAGTYRSPTVELPHRTWINTQVRVHHPRHRSNPECRPPDRPRVQRGRDIGQRLTRWTVSNSASQRSNPAFGSHLSTIEYVCPNPRFW